MKARKFYFVITIFISIFLFSVGILFLETYNVDDATFAFSNDKEPVDIIPTDKEPVNNQKKELINVVLLVGDKWESNTDSVVVASFNPENGKLNLISIPRDTRVDIPGMPIPKINAVYAKGKGADKLLKCLEEILDLNINYYVYLNLNTFRDIIDLLGGVDINIPVDMHYDDPTQDLHIHFTKGLQHLDGKMSELYLRFRKPNNGQFTEEMLKYYNGSDINRIEAQKNFIKELVRQKANLFYLTKITEIVNTVYENLGTNITLGKALELAAYAIDFDVNDLTNYSLPGTDKTIDGLDYFIRSKIKTEEIINKIKNPE